MKTLMMLAVLAMAGFGISACNTTKGLGKDVEATGEAIEDAAENAEEQIEEM